MKTMLSIDWDFFLYRGLEARELPGKETIQLWDWGHDEGMSALLQGLLWRTRWLGFASNGLDPLKETGFRGPSLDHFSAVINNSFDLSKALLLTGDSHAYGFQAARHAQTLVGHVDLVHFDAHHDMGYADGGWTEEDLASCGDWLYFALRRRLVRKVTVVYPDWREPEKTADFKFLDPYRKRLRFTNWSKWCEEPTGKREIAPVINVARSSAWTPPWFDKDFDRFVRSLPVAHRNCEDCSPLARWGRKVGAHDACKPREWEAPADAEAAFLGASRSGLFKTGAMSVKDFLDSHQQSERKTEAE